MNLMKRILSFEIMTQPLCGWRYTVRPYGIFMRFSTNWSTLTLLRLCGIASILFLVMHPCAGMSAEKATPAAGIIASKIVRWVNDGDTIVLEGGVRVRYLGINAPEIEHEKHTAEPYGYEARRENQNLVYKKPVRLELDTEPYDRYGRTLSYVFLLDGVFVNQRIIEKGYAYFMTRGENIKYNRVLLAAQRKAMSAGIGIWRNLAKTGESVVGNLLSKRFHIRACTYGNRIADHNRIVFLQMQSAFQKGFAPCNICLKKWYEGGLTGRNKRKRGGE